LLYIDAVVNAVHMHAGTNVCGENLRIGNNRPPYQMDIV